MRYRTVFHPAARDELGKIPRNVAMTILRKLTELETDPLGFGTAALASRPDRRRLRVGNYRVIHTLDQDNLIVWVVHVEHRSTIYEDRQ